METKQIKTLDDVTHLLELLNSEAPESRSNAWTELRERLFTGAPTDVQSFQQIGKELIEKIEKELEGQLEEGENPLKHWIASQTCPEAKIGAIRILARFAGSNRKVWEEVLLPLATDTQNDADLRAWALYSLYWCQLELTEKNWADIGQVLVEKGLNDPQAKVRQWAALALGEMAAGGKPGQEKSYQTRLTDTYTREAVETALLQRWDCEIDLHVAKQLIIALGKAGGYVHRSTEGKNTWSIIQVLYEAARYDKYEIRQLVPPTVVKVAETILGLKNIPASDKAAAFKELLNILETWFEKPGDSYDTYRSAITSISSLILLVLKDTTGQALPEIQEKVSEAGLGLLFDVAESQQLKGEESVRHRALRGIKYSTESTSGATKQLLIALAAPRLKQMLAEPAPGVAEQIVETLIALLGEKDAADFFAEVILQDDLASKAVSHRVTTWGSDSNTDVEALERLVRRRAALAIGRISQNQVVHDRLVDSLKHQEGITYQRASDALKAMGGQKAIQALIEANKREWVESKFFGPIENADQHGRKILNTTVWMSILSYIVTLVAAVIIIWFGTQLLYTSIQKIQTGETSDLKTTIEAIVGAASAITGLLLPFFWNPSSAVQKANAEMTKLVTAFHGYMGRMRLLGLGFAHAYTEDRADTNFLIAVSNAAGNAMIDSAGVLTDIGAWPGAKGVVYVPDFTGLTWIESEETAKARGLNLTIRDQAYDDTLEEGKVLSQSLGAKTAVEVGTSIALTLSKGKKPEEITLVKVPAFVSKSWEEAQKIANEHALSVMLDKIEYNEVVAENQIAAQDLKADTEVSAGTQVKVVISKGPAPVTRVAVPQFTGGSWEEAQREASRTQLKLVSTHVYNPAPEGMIVEQIPPAGVFVNTETTIKLTLSKGVAPAKRGAPSFINMTWDKALVEALKNNIVLVLDKLVYDDAVPENTIITQNILPGMMITDGAVILLTVSKGPRPPFTTVPNFVGETERTARALAAEYYLEIKTAEPMYSMDVAEGFVLTQSLPESLEVKQGTDVTLTLSKGPEPAITEPEGPEIPAAEAEAVEPVEAVEAEIGEDEVIESVAIEAEVVAEETEKTEEEVEVEILEPAGESAEVQSEPAGEQDIAAQLLAYAMGETELTPELAAILESEGITSEAEAETEESPTGGGVSAGPEDEDTTTDTETIAEFQVLPADESAPVIPPAPPKEETPPIPEPQPIKPRGRFMKKRKR